jgi:hypothetical protein
MGGAGLVTVTGLVWPPHPKRTATTPPNSPTHAYRDGPTNKAVPPAEAPCARCLRGCILSRGRRRVARRPARRACRRGHRRRHGRPQSARSTCRSVPGGQTLPTVRIGERYVRFRAEAIEDWSAAQESTRPRGRDEHAASDPVVGALAPDRQASGPRDRTEVVSPPDPGAVPDLVDRRVQPGRAFGVARRVVFGRGGDPHDARRASGGSLPGRRDHRQRRSARHGASGGHAARRRDLSGLGSPRQLAHGGARAGGAGAGPAAGGQEPGSDDPGAARAPRPGGIRLDQARRPARDQPCTLADRGGVAVQPHQPHPWV